MGKNYRFNIKNKKLLGFRLILALLFFGLFTSFEVFSNSLNQSNFLSDNKSVNYSNILDCGAGHMSNGVKCTHLDLKAVVASDFDFPNGVTDASLSAVNKDMSHKWGLPEGSVMVTVSGGSTYNNGSFYIEEDTPMIFTFSGSIPIMVVAGHSPRVAANGRDGIIGSEGDIYNQTTVVPNGITSSNVGSNYYVENTTNKPIDEGKRFFWHSESTVTQIQFYTTANNITSGIGISLQPVVCVNTDEDGDGVTNEKEKEDGTDPLDPCDFVLAHQTVTPSSTWIADDCDGDGVTNGDEKTDGTDPLDPCDYNPEHITLAQSGDYLNADCDGDGVTNEDEKTDGTDPLDPCDFVLAHQTVDPSSAWNDEDCDGDGVINEDEKNDGTDPLDPCDYNPESVTLTQNGAYLNADCDGDGVTNEDEKEDGTDPLDSCDFVLAHQTVAPSSTWNDTDCDGDGVTNEDEKTDGTDPLDPCDYLPESVTLTPSVDWEILDCDNDGNPNGTDPDPLVATARDDSGSTPALTEVAINILENDDYLPNNHPDNLGITSLSMIGGSALGTVLFDEETGFLNYTPVESESNTTVTIIYQVCNVIPDPNVCASATVTIQVGPDKDNVIDAVDDGYGVETGVSGVIPGSNVLGNDTINGEVVAAEDVVLTSTPTDELTINEDGSVSVAPGTADGTYTIEYTICEVANTDNCDTGTVTVQVGPDMDDVIVAVDDNYSVETRVSGVIPDSNVLGNDTINGEVVAADDVILTSTATDELTINGDGSISITPGTADGIYTIEYTICEVANTDNCDTGTVTVQVGPDMDNVIDAVDDTYGVETGVSGVISDSNVLGNDTINGELVAAEDVILTSTATDELTINEDGSVSVAPGTADGTYTIEYTICEVANTDNCDTGTVTVQVGPDMDNVIDAVDDTYGVETGVSGVIPDSNVLGNDTINGELVSAEDVILTSTATDQLTINEDGSVSVAPGTADGIYTIEYTICEVANTDNCDTGTVTVQVGPDMDNVIVAVDDAYTTDTDNTGLILGSNVLDNDTLNGDPVAATDVVLTSTPTAVLTINEDGSVSVAPGTADGTYTIEYMICEAANAENCDTGTVTVIIEEGDEDEKIEVNQLVTPNSDGKNDFLFIRGVRNANNNTLKIFNRWGVSVYEGKGYNNQNNVFDGRSKARSTVTGNNYLPAGVYYYIFQYENKQQNITDSGYIYVSK
ncbi:gliding motility-associated C-terminal domain-containing protein [Arenibacter palladensis]|uniref:T9SS type B sorting domain-containing protein n=1 Tax=Arenibacter palladensis TaxID=237373 RepID=UPI002FD4BBA9